MPDNDVFQVVFPDYWKPYVEEFLRRKGFQLSPDMRGVFQTPDDPATYIPEMRPDVR